MEHSKAGVEAQMQTQTEKEKENQRIFTILENLKQKYEQESEEHFEAYGELDMYAIAKLEREQHERDYPDIESEEEKEDDSDSDSEYVPN